MILSRRGAMAAIAAAALARPAMAAADAGVASRIDLAHGRLWVDATIGGSAPLRFVLDTGAYTNIIRPEIAQRLGLQRLGSVTVRGIGAGADRLGIVEARDVAIGAFAIEPLVAFNTHDFGADLPAEAAGLLSAALLTRHDSELDFARLRWRIWPDGRAMPAAFQRLPSTLAAPGAGGVRKMHVRAVLDGQPLDLLVDTGAPRGLTLYPQASAASGLFADGIAYAPTATGGFGGTAGNLSRVVRARRFRLGPLVLDRPLVTVMAPAGAARGGDGIIGLDWLALLDLSTQVSTGSLWARRNARAPAPDRYGLSGLWLTERDGATWVADVGHGSPAAAAGIRTGDRIERPADFRATTRLLAGPPGGTVKIAVRRDDRPSEHRFVLRGYL